MRLIFMGTPDFSVSALQALIDAGHEIVAVYSQPPRPKGRGQALTKTPVHTLADAHNIPVHTPKSLRKDADAVAEFAAYEADIAIVAAYGLLLPKAVLDAPKYGCLNIHASLLPRWRGAAPIQYAIWKGDAESGVTIMQMEEGLDTGPMISKAIVPITETTTAQSLHDALSEAGAKLVCDVVADIAENGAVRAEKQDDALSNYAGILKKDDGRLDFNQSATVLDRQIRALNPWPATFAFLPNGQRFKILSAHVAIEAGKGAIGEILADGRVVCGDNTSLRLVDIQPDNGKRMSIQAAFNGKLIAVGNVLTDAPL